MYNVDVNKHFNYSVEPTVDAMLVNGQPIMDDTIKLNEHSYHVLLNDQSYLVEVVSLDRVAKTAAIKVNKNIYHLAATDEYDALLEKLGLGTLNSHKVNDIKAPMPGMVL